MQRTKGNNKTDSSIKELFGFPFKIPIVFEGINFGEVSIDLEIDKRLKETKKGFLIVALLTEIGYLKYFLEGDLKIALSFWDRNKEKRKTVTSLLNLFYIQPGIQYDPLLYFYIKDDEIFEWIRSEGPKAFRFSIIQLMMQLWTVDQDISDKKINKLKECLMEYSFGSSFKDKLLKTGRPEVEIIRILGKEWVRNIYQEINSILRYAKKIHKAKKIEEIYELIRQAFHSYIHALADEYNKYQTSKEIQEKLIRLSNYFKDYDEKKLPDPLSECIQNDKDLRSEFLSFEWYPNVFARKLIAKLLDVSESTIHKIVYAKNRT